jgi:hypothetical protein
MALEFGDHWGGWEGGSGESLVFPLAQLMRLGASKLAIGGVQRGNTVSSRLCLMKLVFAGKYDSNLAGTQQEVCQLKKSQLLPDL